MQRLIQKVDLPSNLIRPQIGHKLVFFFDELMIEARLKEICFEPRFVTNAHYKGKRIVVNDEAVLLIVPRMNFTVWGAIWEVHEVALTGLDICMGAPRACGRFGAFARGPGGEPIVSDYYSTLNNLTVGRAAPEYLQLIIDEGKRRGFTQDYLDEIAFWGDPLWGSLPARAS